MEWRKLKDIIILILLLVNGFLLVLVGARWGESQRYERSALDGVVQVLENNGIHVERDAAAPAGALVPLVVERDLEREAKLARALLGDGTETDNRGGGLYLYRSEKGEVSIRPGGELSAQFAHDDWWHSEKPEALAISLLQDMGLDFQPAGADEQGNRTTVRFRQLWDGVPVFSCEVEFAFEDGFLRTIRGTLLAAGQPGTEEGQVLDLPTALLRFLDGVTATGDVCSAILTMEPGYRASSTPLSGSVRLTAAWLVSTDTADYYLDGATGALSRVPDR